MESNRISVSVNEGCSAYERTSVSDLCNSGRYDSDSEKFLVIAVAENGDFGVTKEERAVGISKGNRDISHWYKKLGNSLGGRDARASIKFCKNRDDEIEIETARGKNIG